MAVQVREDKEVRVRLAAAVAALKAWVAADLARVDIEDKKREARRLTSVAYDKGCWK